MHRFQVLFGLLAGLLFVSQGEARTYQQVRQSGVLRIGTSNEDSLPFTKVVGGRVQGGWEYDIANAVAAEMGLRTEWVTVSFDDLLNQMRKDKIDMVASSLSPTEERRKSYEFTLPTYCSGDVLLSRIGGPKTPKDLVGKRLAVRRNTLHSSYAKSFKGVAEIGGFRSEAEALNQVLYGRYDSMFIDSITALGYQKKYPKRLQLSTSFNYGSANFAVAKGQTLLKQDIDAALRRIRANGTYAKITAKYFPASIDCTPNFLK